MFSKKQKVTDFELQELRNGNCNKKMVQIIYCISIILCCLLYIWGMVLDNIHYSISQEDIYSLEVKEYAQLGQGDLISQKVSFNNSETVMLKEIETIVVNIINEDCEGYIGVRLKENGRIISEKHMSLEEIMVGEWIDIEFNVKLYPYQEYELEWYSSDTSEVPYLLVLDKSQGAPSTENLYSNKKGEIDGKLALKFNYYKIISFTTKAEILLLLVAIFASLAMVCFELKNRRRYIVICSTLTVFVVTIVPLLIMGKYNRPQADDFEYGAKTFEIVSSGGTFFDVIKAALKVDIAFYKTWQGFYVSAFLQALQPGIFGEKYYALTTPIIFIIMGICLYISIRIIRKRFIGDTNLSLFYTIILIGAIASGMPSAAEGLYWYNGAINYIPFIFLTIMNISLIIEYYFSSKKNLILISSVVSFVISGGHMVPSFFNILILTVVVVVCTYKKKYALYITWLSAIMGLAIMYMAPGTKERASQSIGASVGLTLVEALKYGITEMGSWINLQLFCIVAVFIPFMLKIVQYNKKNKFVIHPIVLYIISFIILIGLYCVPFYSMANFGSARLANAIWVAFIFMILINVNYTFCWINNMCFNYIDNREALSIGKKAYSSLSMFLIVGCCIFGNFGEYSVSNSIEAIDELKTKRTAQQYALEMDQRFYEMENASSDILYFDELSCEPKLITFMNIGSDFYEWPNSAYTTYYGKLVATYPKE